MRKLRFILPLLALATMVIGCSKHNDLFNDDSSGVSLAGQRESSSSREVTTETRRVLIMYSAGYNNLTYALNEDINDIANAYVPTGGRTSNVLLVISRLAQTSTNFSSPTPPVLMRFTREEGQETVRDTIKVWEPYTAVTSPEFMSEALQFVKDEFPAASYGMIFSSHGTGWLPSRYYSSPDTYDPDAYVETMSMWGVPQKRSLEQEYSPFGEFPAVKSLGQDNSKSGSQNPYSELEMRDLARAVSIHLDYLVIDACLMGCVEFAYELKDKCDRIAFSPAEVLADGFPYETMIEHLLAGEEADVESVCVDYFNHYDSQPNINNRSATVSLVDCSKLDALADVCTELFAKYATRIRELNPSEIQRYYRFNRHFFYDLKDILLKCGITADERMRLEAALNSCVVYKAATPSFILNSSGGFYINEESYSGLSMYLPSPTTQNHMAGTPFLDNFYKENISWNKRTSLVR